jgi:hypothetical protein
MSIKKFLVGLIMATLVVGGCATVKNFLCSPTDAQKEAANVGKAVVSTLLVAATVYSGGNAVVGLLSQNALPVFDQVVAGYCVAQTQWDSAVKALELAANQTTQLAQSEQPKSGFKAGQMKVATTNLDVNGAIDYIKVVKW